MRMDVIQLESLDGPGERRGARDDEQRADEESRRPEVAGDGTDPDSRELSGPPEPPMPLRGDRGPGPRRDDRHALHERRGAGLHRRFVLVDEREELDLHAESLELEHLIEDEGLRELGEARDQITHAQGTGHDGDRRAAVSAASST